MEFISSVFHFIFWIAVILGGTALYSYNKLQGLAQNIREKSSNVQIAISRKLSLLNQLIDIVKNFQESEQFTHMQISQDISATSLNNSYQQSGAILTSIQGLAERFPNLKASEQYHRLIDSIQGCEADIQQQRQSYNAAVKDYNSICLSIPTVFVAHIIGFSSAPYLEFDLSGIKDITSLKEFKTDDGERLQKLLVTAGNNIADATKVIASHATQAGKQLSDKVKEKVTTTYFYMVPGGVPQGPSSIQDIQKLLAQGSLTAGVMVAEAGSNEWISIDTFTK
jgi:LemA protein